MLSPKTASQPPHTIELQHSECSQHTHHRNVLHLLRPIWSKLALILHLICNVSLMRVPRARSLSSLFGLWMIHPVRLSNGNSKALESFYRADKLFFSVFIFFFWIAEWNAMMDGIFIILPSELAMSKNSCARISRKNEVRQCRLCDSHLIIVL